jgi:hypothetical protein
MRKLLYIALALLMTVAFDAQAGNPDRQGEAGAFELLMNPWARSSGLHTLGTATISGVEALRLNVAGLSHINSTELVFSRAIYLTGSQVYMNAAGLAQRVGKNGVMGVSLMSVDFGDIPITTVDQPEGTGGTFSPSFNNIGFSYSHLFENKISVGATARAISETSSNITATGLALDAGIQYREDNFRLGISLRNIGTPLRFSGEGTSVPVTSPNGSTIMTLQQRSARYELPSVLNIGAAYDVQLDENKKNVITVVANFTSNSFSRDEIGGGLEYSFNNMFFVRGGYRYELGQNASSEIEAALYSGLSAGMSLEVPLNKNKPENRFGIDYSYRATNVYAGTHNIGVRLTL